jgi:kinesin family protein 18/19
VSSIGSIGSMGGHRPSSSYSTPSSNANGISRLRRGSTERHRSPPISYSPPEFHLRDSSSKTTSFTAGQARRMNMGGSLRAAGLGSPSERKEQADQTQSSRRITIGGATMGGSARKERSGIVWR